MSIHGAPPAHRLWVLVAVATHGVVGYAIVVLVDQWRSVSIRPVIGFIGALFADLDLLMPPSAPAPLGHRGLLHTPAFLTFLVIGVELSQLPRRITVALGIGYLSHLILDTLTARGVMWVYPFSTTEIGIAAGIHGTVPTLLLWLLGGGTIIVARRLGDQTDSPVILGD